MKKNKFIVKIGKFNADKVKYEGIIVEIPRNKEEKDEINKKIRKDKNDMDKAKRMIEEIARNKGDIKKMRKMMRDLSNKKNLKEAKEVISSITRKKDDIEKMEDIMEKVRKVRQKYGSISFDWEKIEEKYMCKENEKDIPKIIEDFLVLALATYYVDQRPKRHYRLYRKDKYYFSRNIQITIPVFEIEKWNEVKKHLEKTISFITYDNINYNFIKREDKREEVSLRKNQHDFRSVSLLSGGLDSLSGYFHLQDKKPIYVSVAHSRVNSLLKKLFGEDLKKEDHVVYTYGEKNPPKQKKKYEKHDSKHQFSRSFLYLTCAAVTALAFRNIKTIYIPENGIIARNIGLGESRFSTRTAHPRFLSYYKSLLKKLFPEDDLDIINPFYLNTKGEIVGFIKDKKKLIQKSFSCSHPGEFGDGHCGMCIPCIYRTISIVSSYLEKNINVEDIIGIYQGYGIQILSSKFNVSDYFKQTNLAEKDPKWQKRIMSRYKDGIVNVYDLLRFVIELKKLSSEKLKIKYPELLDDEVFDLYQRFADESINVFCYFSKKNEELKRILDQMTGNDICKKDDSNQ